MRGSSASSMASNRSSKRFSTRRSTLSGVQESNQAGNDNDDDGDDAANQGSFNYVAPSANGGGGGRSSGDLRGKSNRGSVKFIPRSLTKHQGRTQR
jgi:hypothetical protein